MRKWGGCLKAALQWCQYDYLKLSEKVVWNDYDQLNELILLRVKETNANFLQNKKCFIWNSGLKYPLSRNHVILTYYAHPIQCVLTYQILRLNRVRKVLDEICAYVHMYISHELGSYFWGYNITWNVTP